MSSRSSKEKQHDGVAMGVNKTRSYRTLYVLDCDHGVKVGITWDIDDRLKGMQSAFGFRPALLATFDVDPRYALLLEKICHWKLARFKTYGEWYHCHPLEALQTVRDVVASRTAQTGFAPLDFISGLEYAA